MEENRPAEETTRDPLLTSKQGQGRGGQGCSLAAWPGQDGQSALADPTKGVGRTTVWHPGGAQTTQFEGQKRCLQWLLV